MNPQPSLTEQADALKRAGRLEQALQLYRRAAAAAPGAAPPQHDLAAALAEAGRWAEAETCARAALRAGMAAAGTWAVLGYALIGLRRFGEAEEALRQALTRHPSMYQAHVELAHLVWMRSGNAGEATSALDAAIDVHPGELGLRLVKARVLKAAGDRPGAYGVLKGALRAAPGEPTLSVAAAEVAPGPRAAREHALQALRAQPGHPEGLIALANASLSAGDPVEASKIAAELYRRGLHPQHALAIQATAWRLQGDPRYGELYDYERFVGTYGLVTPPGWPSLDAYLGDLAEALNHVHVHHAHPFDQSVRHGSQIPDILESEAPALKAFPAAVAAPIAEHVARLGQGPHPLLARNTGRWRFQGAWSVRLRPGGFHANHVHPQGWISSACYVELPAAVALQDREGWLKLGEPGVDTRPRLGPERHIAPQPGLLALFPSYMWHGTVPFGGDQARLALAFDIVPD